MEEKLKYTSKFNGEDTDSILEGAKKVINAELPSLDEIGGFMVYDKEGKAIGLMSSEQVSKVVGGLIGLATINQDGLMPAFRSMTIHYNDADNVVKYNLPANIGFSMCITVIKNHESGGQAVVFVTGYQGGIVADAVRKGYYLKGISYITNSDSIDIYVKVNSFVFVTAKCMGASDTRFIKSASIVSEIPEGAKEVQL